MAWKFFSLAWPYRSFFLFGKTSSRKRDDNSKLKTFMENVGCRTQLKARQINTQEVEINK